MSSSFIALSIGILKYKCNNRISMHFLTVHGERMDKATDRNIKGRQMAPPKTPQPAFDSQLILNREKWPIKPGEFTVCLLQT
jgi:hypothetical protein